MSEIGNFAITQETIQGGIKLTVKGRIDSINVVELENLLDKVTRSGQTTIMLNMTQVEYICSTGIRVLLKTYKNAQAAGGKFGIESPSESVKNVLGLVALNEMLTK